MALFLLTATSKMRNNQGKFFCCNGNHFADYAALFGAGDFDRGGRKSGARRIIVGEYLGHAALGDRPHHRGIWHLGAGIGGEPVCGDGG